MKFRTELLISPFSFTIDHSKSVVLLGSCFSENIGQRLKSFYFNTKVNPHGTVFNPHSLAQILEIALEKQAVPSDFICSVNGLYKSYLHHSSLFAHCEKDLQSAVALKNTELLATIRQCQTVFITLGTSYVYSLTNGSGVVNNCQKQAQNLFSKRLLSPSEIKDSIEKTIALLKQLNPMVQLVFTLSPVRHIKDGFAENNLSKALLLAGIHSVLKKSTNCHYFPSYELVIDDLRDYRFYEKDLIHPNELAIDYIWQKFESAFFIKKTQEINRKIERLNAALKHRILANSIVEKQKFIASSLQLCAEITHSAIIDLSTEEAYFKNL